MPYIDLGGVPTYYERSGSGNPLVLLHGAFSGADAFAAQTPAMVDGGYEVWVPERRGHARTASLVGWSDGAVVGALVAMQRPDLVDRLVLIGQYYDLAGQANTGMGAALAAMRDNPPDVLRGNYGDLSPDGPGHFPVVFAKTVDMLVNEPTIPMAELAHITAPTLVLQGDRDDVRFSHSVEVVATLPDARLAVLRALTHCHSRSRAWSMRYCWTSSAPVRTTWNGRTCSAAEVVAAGSGVLISREITGCARQDSNLQPSDP